MKRNYTWRIVNLLTLALVFCFATAASAQTNGQVQFVEAKLDSVYDSGTEMSLLLSNPQGTRLPLRGTIVVVFLWDDQWYRFCEGTVNPTESGQLSLTINRVLDRDYVDHAAEPGIHSGMLQYLGVIEKVQLRWVPQ